MASGNGRKTQREKRAETTSKKRSSASYECRYEERVAGRLAGDSPVWDRIGATSYMGQAPSSEGLGMELVGRSVSRSLGGLTSKQQQQQQQCRRKKKSPKEASNIRRLPSLSKRSTKLRCGDSQRQQRCVSANDAFGGVLPCAPVRVWASDCIPAMAMAMQTTHRVTANQGTRDGMHRLRGRSTLTPRLCPRLVKVRSHCRCLPR